MTFILNKGLFFLQVVLLFEPMSVRNFFAKLVYALICNLFMSFLINITGSLLVTLSFDIDWKVFLINWGISYYIGFAISMFVPLVMIGKWFTAKFNVDNSTYTSNIRYRLLASFIITLIYFIFLNPTITVFDYFLTNGTDPLKTFLDWLWQAPVILVCSYAYSIVSDYLAYHTAHLVDRNF